MDFQQDETFPWVCLVPVSSCICFLGIWMNVLSIFVWKRVMRSNKRGNKSTALYLVGLAYCNIGYLVFFLLVETLPMFSEDVINTYLYNVFYSWFGFPALNTFFIANIWLVLAAVLNRWALLAYPVRSRDFYTDKMTKLTIAITLLISLLFSVPNLLKYYPQKVNTNIYQLQLTKYGSSQAAFNFQFWCHCVFLTIAPLAVTAFVDWSIIKQFGFKFRPKPKEKVVTLKSLTGKYPHLFLEHELLTFG